MWPSPELTSSVESGLLPLPVQALIKLKEGKEEGEKGGMEVCKKKSIEEDTKKKQIETKKMYLGCDSCKRDNVEL